MKKLLTILFAGALTIGLVACGNTNTGSESAPAIGTTIKVGASPSPHAEILEFAKSALAEEGITLEIIEFTDYVLPNTALESGDIDANFFQHAPFLDKFNAESNADIVSVATVHFEPLGLYSGRSSDLSNIPQGAVIAVPSDSSNEARALLLLESLGIITLNPEAGLNATPIDIVENPYDIEIFEIEGALLVSTLPDVDFAVINGNYAVTADILDTVLASEDAQGDGATTYANILAVNRNDESDPAVQKLIEVLNSEDIKEFIDTTYKGLFVPSF